MATLKLILDKRISHQHRDGSFPLVLRLGHKSKTRYISFGMYLFENQFDAKTYKVTGIQNAVRHSKRVNKIFADIDLWLDENKPEISLWTIKMLKDHIEKRFFKKHSLLNLLVYAAKVLNRQRKNSRFSTASSYEDGLKSFVKYQISLDGGDDNVIISTLFEKDNKGGLRVKPEYAKYDLPIKAFTRDFAKDYQAYLNQRFSSSNTVGIHLRSIQSILNDACESYDELQDHKPLAGIKKTSSRNEPIVLTMEEIDLIRKFKVKTDNPKFHVRNYFLFMFNNMGMNFYDVALAKVWQFDKDRFKYVRKKTISKGDVFSIKQNNENLDILNYYIKGKKQDDYIFPLIPKGTPEERIFKVKKFKTKWFNDHMKEIAISLGIQKKITTYTARDTWTNLGLGLGIDLRKISKGLGHSSVQVTEKHYDASIQQKVLDEINAQITKQLD